MKLDVSNTDFLNSKPAKKAISPNAAACRDLIQDQGVQGFEKLWRPAEALLDESRPNALWAFLSEPGQAGQSQIFKP